MSGRFLTWFVPALLLLSGGCGADARHPCEPEVCPAGYVCNAAQTACELASPALGEADLVGVGAWPSLATAPDGTIWFAGYDTALGALAVGTWLDEQGLSYEHADGAGDEPASSDLGQHASLCIDTEGRPHVAHFDAASGDLLHAWHDGARWRSEVVDQGSADVGRYASLACGSDGVLHVAYYDATNARLRYAREAGAGWTAVDVPLEVAGAVDYGRSSSLALRGGEPVIAFYEAIGGDLYLAALESGAWRLSLLAGRDGVGGADICDAGRHVSLAVDDDGDLSLAYYDATAGALRFARSAGGVLEIETVDDGRRETALLRDVVGQAAQLGFDPRGRAHILYFDSTGLTTRRALRHFDGTWQIETLDDCAGVALWYTQAAARGRHIAACAIAQDGAVSLRLRELAVAEGTP